MIEPFDSFDEFSNPIIKKPELKVEAKEEPVKVEAKEEPVKVEVKARGRKKKVAEPVDIPAEVPALEE